MKNSRTLFSCGLILVILFNALAIPPSFAGPRRELLALFMAGRVSNAVPNTILSGPSAPRSTIGIEGDFYIDSKALVFYGPKRKSGWPPPISLRGPQGLVGAKGASGSNGTDGKSSATSGGIGPQGVAGPVGPRGEAGTAGVVGPAGPTGAVGPSGAAGVAGAAGIAGVPGSSGAQGLTGAAGSQGPPGSSGSQGSAGATGAVGLTGASGASGPSGSAGPSNVYVISIPAWSLSTSSAGTSSDSLQFGTLTAQKSYRYSIILHGVTSASNAYFGVSMKIGPISTTTSYESAINENRSFVGASFIHRYTFIIEGTIVVGSSDSWFKVNVVDGTGVTSGADTMSISGQAIIQLVGQIN